MCVPRACVSVLKELEALNGLFARACFKMIWIWTDGSFASALINQQPLDQWVGLVALGCSRESGGGGE